MFICFTKKFGLFIVFVLYFWSFIYIFFLCWLQFAAVNIFFQKSTLCISEEFENILNPSKLLYLSLFFHRKLHEWIPSFSWQTFSTWKYSQFWLVCHNHTQCKQTAIWTLEHSSKIHLTLELATETFSLMYQRIFYWAISANRRQKIFKVSAFYHEV